MAFMSEAELKTILANNPSLQKRNPNLHLVPKKLEQHVQTKPAEAPQPEKKKNKYRNEKVYVYKNGVTCYGKPSVLYDKPIYTFDSIKEFRRWEELKLFETTGVISGLKRQVPLLIQEKFQYNDETIQAIRYQADFMYVQDGKTIVEDVKGKDSSTGKYITTKDFTLKWKLLKYHYPDYQFRIF